MENLRELIRKIVLETLTKEEELLVEPDENEKKKKEKEEASSGGVAGVSVPLGAGPSYPGKSKPRKRPADVAAASFGGAKIVKRK